MLNAGDLLQIEKNQLKYKRKDSVEKSIPAGVYEVMEADFTPRRNWGPIFVLEKVGVDDGPITVDWKSLQNNTKWRTL
ncbi:hypothetical protein LCGC14_0456920 [marine sediment metagenome]|uniref:Uncharacterized protein n=1 Tax=marine sediment metagenome TaxID=412755 RepID=A0A0F9SGB1_9ZZZZ|nr:hypothetical protein [Candidatus Aminicenantes bacterium]